MLFPGILDPMEMACKEAERPLPSIVPPRTGEGGWHKADRGHGDSLQAKGRSYHFSMPLLCPSACTALILLLAVMY